MDSIKIGEKFRLVRSALGKTLQEVANDLGLKGTGHLSQIESGKKSTSESTIKNFKRCYNINDIWWETGEGEMFVKYPPSDELGADFLEVLRQGGIDEGLAYKFLTRFATLSAADQHILMGRVYKIIDQMIEEEKKERAGE